ncbi:hypothetical protein F2Q69_00004124 [Brassica cretica]|uniref:Uncharacterized protein n=1 Tax=Brassica cretica TaxID=69181 RepID=A0A8S9NSS8_BRACR|nr:hypothetical protein F2Q69_00004124 [Brassica cretica]
MDGLDERKLVFDVLVLAGRGWTEWRAQIASFELDGSDESRLGVGCTVVGTDLMSVPLVLSLYLALSSLLIAPDIFMACPRPYMAVLNALAWHHTAIFSQTPPKPSHDQSKSFLDLTSQDNYFRTLLKLN